MTKSRLRAMRAFKEGFASAFDIGLAGGAEDVERTASSRGTWGDVEKIREDWRRVGRDLRVAGKMRESAG